MRFLARLQEKDLRTSMGKTLRYLTEECGVSNYDLEKLTAHKVKSSVSYAPSIGSEWKVKLAQEL